MTRNKTFRSLRHRNYRLYFFGQMLSLVGSWAQTTALMWLAFSLTGESKWPAFITAVQIGPTFLLGPVGGWLADFFPKRQLILATQTAYLILAILLTVLVFFDWITPAILLIVMLGNGLIQAIDLPARLTFVAQLVPREDLTNSVALNSLLFNVARLIGPAIAGILLYVSGASLCVFFNAITYFAVLWALLRMDFPPEPDKPKQARSSPWGGFVILARQPHIGVWVILAGALALSGWPLLALLPAYATNVLHQNEGTYSLLLSAIGAGALLGALAVARYGAADRNRAFLLVGCSFVLVGLFGLVHSAAVWFALLGAAIFGAGMISVLATGQSAVQLGSTDATRGRVMGIWAMSLSGGVPLGNLLIGPIADEMGVLFVMRGQTIVVGLLVSLILVERIHRAMKKLPE